MPIAHMAYTPAFLPIAGPWTDKVWVENLPNLLANTTQNPATCIELSPNQYNLVEISDIFQIDITTQPAVFLRCHELKLKSSGYISANGQVGGFAFGAGSVGGDGAPGPLAGGGGAQLNGAGGASGGTGAGVESSDIAAPGSGDSPGAAGISTYPVGGYSYTWGTGFSTQVTGENGAGAGYKGEDVINEVSPTAPEDGGGASPVAGNGGASGAGLIGVACNILSESKGTIAAIDGNGFNSGVVVFFVKHKTDATSPFLAGNVLNIYQINDDGTLTLRNWNETW